MFRELQFFNFFPSAKFHLRQSVYNIHSLKAHAYDAQKQIVNIARIFVLAGPVVAVVFNAGGLVHSYLIAVKKPFDGAPAVYYIALNSSF